MEMNVVLARLLFHKFVLCVSCVCIATRANVTTPFSNPSRECINVLGVFRNTLKQHDPSRWMHWLHNPFMLAMGIYLHRVLLHGVLWLGIFPRSNEAARDVASPESSPTRV
eukprot:434521-Amphidinium_carterae.1